MRFAGVELNRGGMVWARLANFRHSEAGCISSVGVVSHLGEMYEDLKISH